MLHQVGVERQDHERQVRVDDADVHREVGVEDGQRLVDDADGHQEAVEQAVVGQDAHPGVHANQDRRPGRHHDQQQQHGLHLLAGTGDGIGHRVADQQADQGADERHLQRAEIGVDVQRVARQHHVVAEVHHHLQRLVGVLEHLGVRRDRDVRFSQADFQHDDEGQQEEQEQPEERDADDGMPTPELQFGEPHDCSTTPLSSYQLMYTGCSQVGRFTWRSALAMKACTIIPEASLM
ncbi:hypothetical protein D3C76_1014290 [compost metagenome]